MESFNVVEISTIIAIVGCFVGLAGWLTSRDKKLVSDAHWRGSVDAKLDLIVGIKSDMTDIKSLLGNHSERIVVVENKLARLQKNMDELKKLRGEIG